MITDYDLCLLRHTLGVGKHIPKAHWGFRNHYLAEKGDKDMTRLESLNLVRRIPQCSFTDFEIFTATEDGCNAIELSKAAKRRALKGESCE